MKFSPAGSAALLVVLLLITYACTKEAAMTTSGSVSPTVTEIVCNSATFSATAISDVAYTGNASVPYSGGNGAAYTSGAAIPSSGVTGLNATLQPGILANGSGSLTYTLSGTPASSGTASFALTLGDRSCTLALTVFSTSPGSNTTVTTVCSSLTSNVARMVCLAEAFKATLSATQLATVQLQYTKENAVRWSNLPQALSRNRVGIALGTLSTTQLTAAKALLQEATGNATGEGYTEVQQIMLADDYLGANGGGTATYGSGNYYMALLGTPSLTGTWQFQFGGHHLAVANTYSNGKATSATPHFEAIEPTTFVSSGTTIVAMGNEQAGMIAMLAGLSSAQLATAKLSTSFTDIVVPPGKDGQFPSTKSGLAVSALSTAQKSLVLAAMKPWIQDVDETTAAALLISYEAELNQTYIAFSGTSALNSNGDYVRIDGPSVWIEFSAQRGIVFTPTHFHTIWRDRQRDYGANFTF
jgi:Protein of unknown function (DUF3500)